jgi:hypothetical protein
MGIAEFLNKTAVKGSLAVLNIISIIVIIVFMSLQGVNPDTKKEFNANITVITAFSIILMFCWWGLSSTLFAGSPVTTTYYMFFMMAFLLALSFISVSAAVMIKQQ